MMALIALSKDTLDRSATEDEIGEGAVTGMRD